MIHKINFEIDIETNTLRDEQYAEIMDVIETQMKTRNPEGLSFKEINEVIPLEKLKFHPSSIQYPDMSYDENDFSIKETKITIKA